MENQAGKSAPFFVRQSAGMPCCTAFCSWTLSSHRERLPGFLPVPQPEESNGLVLIAEERYPPAFPLELLNSHDVAILVRKRLKLFFLLADTRPIERDPILGPCGLDTGIVKAVRRKNHDADIGLQVGWALPGDLPDPIVIEANEMCEYGTAVPGRAARCSHPCKRRKAHAVVKMRVSGVCRANDPVGGHVGGNASQQPSLSANFFRRDFSEKQSIRRIVFFLVFAGWESVESPLRSPEN